MHIHSSVEKTLSLGLQLQLFYYRIYTVVIVQEFTLTILNKGFPTVWQSVKLAPVGSEWLNLHNMDSLSSISWGGG